MRLEIKEDKVLIDYETFADILSIFDQKIIFLQAIEAQKPIEIKADKVEGIDTASVQLFVSFMKTVQKRQLSVKLENPSREMKRVAELIGISNAFGIQGS